IRPKGDVKASTERTDTDKKHARRLLKHKQKLKSKDETKKSTPEEESKEEKRDLLKKLGKMKNVRIEKTDKNRSNRVLDLVVDKQFAATHPSSAAKTEIY
ncbi:unnamed protein product, partial [Adineta steineri]